MNLENFQLANLLSLAKNDGFQFTKEWFPYTSGCIGPYYVQSVDVCKTGTAYQLAIHGIMTIVEQIIRDTNQPIDVIAGGESRDWPFSSPIAEKLGAAHLMIYKDGGMLGPDIKGKRVLHIADLNNEGSSPRDKWVPAIRNAGGIIDHIVFFVDRLEDGVQVMKDLEITSHAVIPLHNDAWRLLSEKKFITAEVYDSLLAYWKDRKAWGIQKLIEYPEVLINLLQKDRVKGLKIFNHYYPLMGQNLLTAIGFEEIGKFNEIYY